MKITKKRVFIALGCMLGLLVLVVGGALFWYGGMLGIMLANTEVQGETGAIPEAKTKDFPPITEGDADWVCWRGPRDDGKSLVTNIKTDWSGGLKQLWEVDYLCQGRTSGTWSAPVIKGNRVVVMGRAKDNDLVFCLSPEDGSLVWKRACSAKASSSYGSGPRATPWIDDDRVYTFGRSGDLICWKLLDGEMVWHQNVSDHGGKESTWGHSASPLVTKNLIVVPGGGTARTLAFEKETGKLVWKAGSGGAGYAAMVRMPMGDRDAVLNFHAKGLCAVDLEKGEEMWDVPWETNYDVNATTPVFEGDKVFITSGYGTGCALLQVDETSARTVWTSKVVASHHSDLHIIDSHLYGYSGDSTQNRGDFKCVEFETGKETWSTGEMGWGTCVRIDGYILCLDIKSNLYLMKPDPANFEKIAEMKGIFGKVRGAVWTVPVIANGRLYLRFMQTLKVFDIARN